MSLSLCESCFLFIYFPLPFCAC
uniref:Uncharacterized protein n=1 Tax=Arundo donax TaxID=35708 RepID=A0A0A9E7A0_ARUDO